MSEYKIHIGTGENRKTYVLDRSTVLNTEAMAVEVATGIPFFQVMAGLEEVSALSLTAVVWMLRRREEPDLPFGAVQFPIDEFDVDEADEAPAPKAGPEPS